MINRMLTGFILIHAVLFACDPCKTIYKNDGSPTVTEATFVFQIVNSENKDFFFSSPDYHFDSLVILNDQNQNIVFRSNSLSDSYFIGPIHIISTGEKETAFSNLITKYYYLNFSKTDIDTLEIEYKCKYVGKCNNEQFDDFDAYYNEGLSFSFRKQVSTGLLLESAIYFEFKCIKL
ncbi:MAG: hypothetical protein HY738_24230 [Bacteroidia bacterium]|nr:hypothetical protein [Bacteroidia bacterium]